MEKRILLLFDVSWRKRILMLFLVGATLYSGVLAVQQLSQALGGATVQHLQQHPQHPFYHTMLTGAFALPSAISGAALYRLRRTR